MKSTKPAALTGILSLLLLGPMGQAKRESANYAIGVEVIGGLAGPSASASFSNFGVNEPITGLSLKDLPDVRNFAGFVGGVVPLDQDQDGLPDHQEVALGTDPGMSDTDGDGLTDKEEVDLGTNPLVADSDGDQYSDYAEFLAQTDPKDASDSPNALPVFVANQSLSIAENQPAGSVVGHLQASDQDGHALTFGIADGPGDADNLFFHLEGNGTLLAKKSFDFESEPTLSFRARVEDGNGGSVEASFTVSVTNLIEDLDGDGIEDAYDADDDGDGLTDAMEVSTHGTDPGKADSDGDGFSDGVEVAKASDPMDANSMPNQLPAFDANQTLTIAENQPAGTVVGTLLATDPDGQALIYELQGGLPGSPGLSTVGHNAWSHSLFVGTGGSLWAKGTNYDGQIGDGTTVSKTEPTRIIEMGVVAVEVSPSHSLYLMNDQSLWAMGSNRHGQLGDGTATNRSSPVKVDDDVVLISAGSEHSMYVKKDGSLWVMGRNWYGELGTGNNGNDGNWQSYYSNFKEGYDVSTPVKIDDNVVSISAGDIHSLYAKADGSLWSMGLNDRGQLGDGTLVDRNSPVKVVDSGVQLVSAGSQVSAFIKSDGSLWKLGKSIVKLDDGVVKADCGGDEIFYVKTDGSLLSIGFEITETDESGSAFSENLAVTPVLLDDNVLFVSADNSFEGGEVLYHKKDGTFWQQTKPYVEWPAMPTWQGASKTQIQVPGTGESSPKSFVLSPQGVLTSSRIFDHETEPTLSFEALVRDELGGTQNKTFSVTVTNDVWDDPEVVAMLDYDNDGLTNGEEEQRWGTDINNPDTDGDGLKDGEEVAFRSNPTIADSDQDGLSDLQEFETGTNPRTKDTDKDGFGDSDELTAGTSPEDRFDYPGAPEIRGKPNSGTDAPDGKRYEVHRTDYGVTLQKALKLASKLGGTLATLSGEEDPMKDYLLDRMAEEGVSTESDSMGFVGMWLAPVEGATLAMDEDGSLYLDELEAEDRLAFFIVYEVPEIRPPAVRFAELKVTPNKRVNAFSEILDDGGETPTRFGVRISESISPRPDDPTLRTVSGKLQNSGTILTQINRLTPGVTYYFRPYAENSAGETIGPLKKIRIEEEFEAPFDAQVLGATEWFESPWFGTFHRGNDNWIFHAELGWWIYVANKAGFGQWFWNDAYGWCWTRETVYPFIWSHRSNNWLYKLDRRNNRNIFWNYSTAMAEMP